MGVVVVVVVWSGILLLGDCVACEKVISVGEWVLISTGDWSSVLSVVGGFGVGCCVYSLLLLGVKPVTCSCEFCEDW